MTTLEPPLQDDCILSIGLKTELAVKPVAKVTKIRNASYLNVLRANSLANYKIKNIKGYFKSELKRSAAAICTNFTPSTYPKSN